MMSRQITSKSYLALILTALLFLFSSQKAEAQCALTLTKSMQMDLTCGGGNNGYVILTAVAGVPPYMYYVDGMLNYSGVFSNLSGGYHRAIVTDALGCADTLPLYLNEPMAVGGMVFAHEDISCNGASDGTFVMAGTGGTAPYSYSLDGATPSSNNQYTGLVAGTYVVTITDANGCSTNEMVNIVEPAKLQLNTNVIVHDTLGVCNGVTMLNGQGGTGSYQYSVAGMGTLPSRVCNNMCAGEYTFYLQDDNGCMAMKTDTVQGNATGNSAAPCSKDLFEPNNTFSEAKELPEIGINKNASICDPSDEDWFFVEVSDKKNLAIELSSLPADYDMEIYNGTNGLMMVSQLRGMMKERLVLNNLQAGDKIYIRVKSVNGAFDTEEGYSLRVLERAIPFSINVKDEGNTRGNDVRVWSDANEVHISQDQPEEANVRILDVQGRVLMSQRGLLSDLSLETMNLPYGMYLIEIAGEGWKKIERWVKR